MRPTHPHHMHPVHTPYPDNWPWSESVPPRPPHSCCPPPPPPSWAPHPCLPPPFVPTPGGFCAQEPENGTPVSGLAKAIRHSKRAFLSLTSVPALFSVDVQDGDIVKPVPADDSFKDLLCAMGPATKLPDAVWVPAFRTVDSQPDTQTDEEVPAEPTKPALSDYDPSFYGVAYRGVNRVMIGPVVTHPRFMFHTGDKVYADANGDLTLTENKNFVGVCLAPGALYLLPQTSAFSEFLEAYRQEIIETTTKEIIESIEGGELDGGSITVTVPGTTTDRPLSDRLQDAVNIKDFGAVGDGTTDNAMAFFLAMQRAQELGSNVCLFIPVGDYLTTQLPTVPCYGPGSIIFGGQTYASFELLFTIKGGISKDAAGRYKVNPAEFSEEAIRDLINKILGIDGDGGNPGGGGIGIDEDGNIVIDFGSLTEEQIQELLEILNKYMPELKEPIVDPNGGLVNGPLGLAIKPATQGGLSTTALGAGILLDDDSGLKLSTTGVAVKAASAGGLQVDSTGVAVKAASAGGLQVDSTGVAVKAKASGGVVVDAGGVAVRTATTSSLGIVRPDNLTCTVENGVMTVLGLHRAYELGDAELKLYVRPDGDDSNDGKANTPARAWATIEHAVAWISEQRFIGGGLVTVHIANGTYTPSTKGLTNNAQFSDTFSMQKNIPDVIHPADGETYRVRLVGNVSSPSSVIVNINPDYDNFLIENMKVCGVTFVKKGTPKVDVDAIVLTSSGCLANVRIVVGVPLTSFVLRLSDSTVYGTLEINAQSSVTVRYEVITCYGGLPFLGCHSFSLNAGLPGTRPVAISLTGNTMTAQHTASVTYGSTLHILNGTGSGASSGSSTFTGNITAKRYLIYFASTIYSSGLGVNFFPGTSAGTADMPSSLYQ